MLRTFVIPFFLAVSCHAAFSFENAAPLIDAVKEPFTGDFAEMKKFGVVRVLIPFSMTDYFIQDGAEKGLAAETLHAFEDHLNKGVKREADRTRVVLVPTRRDELISGLVEGGGDIAVAELTITPQRLEQVDFSNPVIKNVREVVVTTDTVADFTSIEDLAGLAVHVRKSASYYESLREANETLEARGLAPIEIVTVDEWLEDEDLLEMVFAGAIPATVIDEHKAKQWLSVFDTLKVHPNAPLREGGSIAWAFRKESPQLTEVVNAFIAKAAQGTTLGNILLRRYYKDTEWIKNPKIATYQEKLDKLRTLFGTYGEEYRIDPLLLAALAFQESKFNEKARNRSGAIGIMQMLPSTAADRNVGIKNIQKLENNIEAGAKYLRFMADHYFPDKGTPEDQKLLMALASYNAGPNRVAHVRKKAEDPNQWFENVEWQVAKSVGSEPVRYVKNIYIYYVLFKSFEVGDEQRETIRLDRSPAE